MRATKIQVGISGVPAEMQTENLPVISTELSLYQPARRAVCLFVLKLKREFTEIYSLRRSPSKCSVLKDSAPTEKHASENTSRHKLCV